MKRRDFFRNGMYSSFGLAVAPAVLVGCNSNATNSVEGSSKTAKNIIFMVSDGMSAGTLSMADALSQRKNGRASHWLEGYREDRFTRAIMETASANSLVTDSAAAGSAWGGGKRVNNGALNVGPNGEQNKTIFQKFKEAGKSVGCVTTVQITHATPASFCVNIDKRGKMNEIADQYLELAFDVYMGGGLEQFKAETREDKKDLLEAFRQKNYHVFTDREALKSAPDDEKPILGVFHEGGLPFTLDRENDSELLTKVPTLAEMTAEALRKLSKNENGFALQIEGGKVDWAAHANDTGALLYDQLAFDDALGVALEFAESNGETLVIFTSDHGNSNPGLLSSGKVNEMFDQVHHFKHTNEWVLAGLTPTSSVAQIKERIEAATGIGIKDEDADSLIAAFRGTYKTLYQKMNSPINALGHIMTNYTSVGWAGNSHTSDYVE
ncbi:MAG: alkaline phosphatase, partial [Cyclobacteriaceae bacterium]